MKTNEAPERLYLSKNIYSTFLYQAPDPDDETAVEYTRTDALIKKACEFIRKGGNRGDAYIVTEFGEEVFNFVQFAEDLKNYIKGK